MVWKLHPFLSLNATEGRKFFSFVSRNVVFVSEHPATDKLQRPVNP